MIGFAERQALLADIASTLKHLATTFDLAAVVTNQTVSRFGAPVPPLGAAASGGLPAGQSDEEFKATFEVETQMEAALGMGWAHAVNTRFFLDGSADTCRILRVVKSPVVPLQAILFHISDGGLFAGDSPEKE
jgi:hypothetical protein